MPHSSATFGRPWRSSDWARQFTGQTPQGIKVRAVDSIMGCSAMEKVSLPPSSINLPRDHNRKSSAWLLVRALNPFPVAEGKHRVFLPHAETKLSAGTLLLLLAEMSQHRTAAGSGAGRSEEAVEDRLARTAPVRHPAPASSAPSPIRRGPWSLSHC